MNYELLAAKKRQRVTQSLMRCPAPYKVRLQSVALFGLKEPKHWPR